MRGSDKIVLVTRPTRMEGLKRRFSTKMQAQFYVQQMKGDFNDYENEEQAYLAAVEAVTEVLGRFRRVQTIDRGYLPNFIFAPTDIVVTLGQDGLVANSMKYLQGQQLIGVNPDPKRWDGVLLPFKVEDVAKIMPEVIAGRRPILRVTMAEARLNTKQSLFAVNDFFIGARTHTSARYEIRVGDRRECHSSSGVVVSTGLGSTGWLKSIMEGARQITRLMASMAGAELALKPDSKARDDVAGAALQSAKSIPWNAPYLMYSVREAFPSRTTQGNLVFGKVDEKTPLIISSLMPENGIIFSDGIEQDFIEFASGTEATILPAKRQGYLVQ